MAKSSAKCNINGQNLEMRLRQLAPRSHTGGDTPAEAVGHAGAVIGQRGDGAAHGHGGTLVLGVPALHVKPHVVQACSDCGLLHGGGFGWVCICAVGWGAGQGKTPRSVHQVSAPNNGRAVVRATPSRWASAVEAGAGRKANKQFIATK